MSSDPASYIIAPDPRLYHQSNESYYGFRREGAANNNTRSYQRDHHILPAPAHTPLSLPAPPIPPTANTCFPPSQHPTSRTVNPAAVNMNPYDQYVQQQGGKNAENNPRGILKSVPQSYPAPFPGMYPVPPPQGPHGQHQQLQPRSPYSHQQFPGQGLPFPTQPPGILQGTPLPPDARVIGPPRLPNADDLKYRCSVCGRFRSTSYHYKHPIPPGQLPARTICRKCKEAATDTEDETESTESFEDRRRSRRRRSRSAPRAASVGVISRRGGSRRGRSQSRAVYSQEEDFDYYQPPRERSWSRSSSLEVQPIHRRSRRGGSRRRRSPSAEVIRYVERPERPKLLRRVTYVEELPHRTYDDEYDDDDDDSEEHGEEYRVRRVSRPPTPAPRVIRRQYSDPFIHLARPGGRRGYLDAPPPTRETSGEMALAPRTRSRDSSHHRVLSAPHVRRDVSQYSESEDDVSERGRLSLYRRAPSRDGRSRPRSSNRQSRSRGNVPAGRHRSVSVVRRARSPVDWHPSELDELSSHAMRPDRDFWPVRSSRRQRSRSGIRREQASRLLQPDGVVTREEHHALERSSEDYDACDKDGMRIRVREI